MGIPHKTKSTCCSIFLTSKIINAKKTRFYKEGAVDFAEMCSRTYSYQYEHDRMEKKEFLKFLFLPIFVVSLLVQIASPVVSTEPKNHHFLR
jgi:hypothetical protein